LFVDYLSREFSLWPHADMKTRVGVCLPLIFFDNQSQGTFSSFRTSNQYFGIGPHLGMEFWHHLPLCGLSLYSRLDGMLTVGTNHQRFVAAVALPDTTFLSAEAGLRKVRESPAVHAEAGLSWKAPWPEKQLRFDLGYTFERWWYVGQTSVEDIPPS